MVEGEPAAQTNPCRVDPLSTVPYVVHVVGRTRPDGRGRESATRPGRAVRGARGATCARSREQPGEQPVQRCRAGHDESRTNDIANIFRVPSVVCFNINCGWRFCLRGEGARGSIGSSVLTFS